MLIPTSLRRRLFACIVAGGFSLTATGTDALAGHCGCEASCDACPRVTSGCTCNCSKMLKFNCLKKAFGAVSTGFDKLLNFQIGGCDDTLCDDACDAAMIEDLMVPIAPMFHHHDTSNPHTVYPNQHDHHDPSQHHEMDHGHSHDGNSDAAHPHDHDLNDHPETIEIMPPPVRLQDPPTNPDSEVEEGSLFDTLSDPFGDDAARTKAYRPIRPSAYLNRPANSRPTNYRPANSQAKNLGELMRSGTEEVELRPINRREVPRTYPASSRRVRSSE